MDSQVPLLTHISFLAFTNGWMNIQISEQREVEGSGPLREQLPEIWG